MTHHMQLKVIKATIANLAILRRITWIVSATDANPEVESGNQMTSASPPCHIKYQSRNRRAFCIRMRQYGLLKCHRATTEAFSMNCLHSVPAFAGCFLELNDVYWVLRSTNMFFKVSRYFYDESEFIVASLSPLRGQSFLS